MPRKQRTNPELFQKFVYIVKCLAGVIVCYCLYKQFPVYPFYWAIVSVVLALSPDNSNAQAYDRIKANLLGCAVGLILYPLHMPELLIICSGLLITIVLGFAINAAGTLRVSLAAFIIIMLQEETHRHWYVALERVICVTIGCVVALMLTLMFNFLAGGSRK